jgi:hypothetical protein
MEGKEVWSHRESNPDLEFRKLLFYPLNYETRPEVRTLESPEISRRNAGYGSAKIELSAFHER